MLTFISSQIVIIHVIMSLSTDYIVEVVHRNLEGMLPQEIIVHFEITNRKTTDHYCYQKLLLTIRVSQSLKTTGNLNIRY